MPHKKDKDLKFSWDNLFLSCQNCNFLKHTSIGLANCLKEDYFLKIQTKFRALVPFENILIEIDDPRDLIQAKTKNLLEKVFNGATDRSISTSEGLRND